VNNISHLIKSNHFQLAILQNANLTQVKFPLSLSEISRLNSKTNQIAKNQTLASHYLLKSILGEEHSTNYDMYGRPYIENSDWDISFAHTESITATAIIRQPNRVGIDIENLHKTFDEQILIRQAFLPEEKKTIQVLQKAWNLNEKNSVLALWSLKESFFKARGGEFSPKNIWIQIEDVNPYKINICENIKNQFIPIPTQDVSLQVFEGILLSYCVL